MTQNPLEKRRAALEDEYFARENARKLAAIREAATNAARVGSANVDETSGEAKARPPKQIEPRSTG